jgi:uncharacterized membrane protein
MLMIKQKKIYVGIALICLLLTACKKNQAEEPAPVVPGDPNTAVTYSAVIGPLIQTRCAPCHAGTGPANSAWAFNGYNSVVANASRINNAVLVTKTMPLGGSLSAAELQSLKDWFDQGMPQ